MDFKVQTEKSIPEVLEELKEALAGAGWEIMQEVDLGTWLPEALSAHYLVEVVHPSVLAQMMALGPGAALLCMGRLLLYEEEAQTTVALMDTRLLASFLPGVQLQQSVTQPCEKLVQILQEVGEVDTATGDLADLGGNVGRRLSRIEGQIRGLQKMLEEDRECDAILTQLAAASGALKQVAATLLSHYMVQCVREDLEQGGDGFTVNQKLLNVLF